MPLNFQAGRAWKKDTKLFTYVFFFPFKAKVNNSSLIGLGYTQTLKPGKSMQKKFRINKCYFSLEISKRFFFVRKCEPFCNSAVPLAKSVMNFSRDCSVDFWMSVGSRIIRYHYTLTSQMLLYVDAKYTYN